MFEISGLGGKKEESSGLLPKMVKILKFEVAELMRNKSRITDFIIPVQYQRLGYIW